MLGIQNKQIQYNLSSCNGRKVQFIVIHDTANTEKGANAIAHYNYFNGGNRFASADYFCDELNIVCLNPAWNAYFTWQVGDGKGKYTVDGIAVTNAVSIGIEICINSDGNYNQAVSNAVELAASLLKQHGLGMSRLIRHYDASHKHCPATIIDAGTWDSFKSRVSAILNGGTPAQAPVAVIEDKPASNGVSTVKRGSTGAAVADLQNKLNTLGFDCGKADGIFGNDTYNAIIKFQRSKVLAQDGIVGPNTWSAINAAVSAKQAPAATPQIDLIHGKMATVTASSLNVRKGPGTNYAVIGTLNKGDKIKIDFLNGDWYSVYYGDHGGFIHKDFVAV